MIARPLYSALTALAAPAIDAVLRRRLAAGKEDPARIGERRGIASLPRPNGSLVWIHAASNGEAMSALPLIERILERDPFIHVLITTGTLTSARLLESRLPDRTMHQFVPVDRTPWVRRFLAHWSPDAAIWVESEFWPALIWETRRRGIPTALVNGRVSKKSLGRWRRMPGLSRDLIAGFDPCLGQSAEDAEALQNLGAVDAEFVGNLKRSGAPLPADEAVLSAERERIAGRTVWLAASSHPGEEEIVAEAHHDLREEFPDLLTVLVPRHPARGQEIAVRFRSGGAAVMCRSESGNVSADCEVLIADTLGELGLFFRLAPVALICGSLAGGHGGHNPLEAARLGCVPLFGPDMANFRDVAEDLKKAGAGLTVADARDLSRAVAGLLRDAGRREEMAAAADRVAKAGILDATRVLNRLNAVLPCGPEGGEP